jgi:hypothetical protein
MPSKWGPQGKYAGFGDIRASWALARILEENGDHAYASKVCRLLQRLFETFRELAESNLSDETLRDAAILFRKRAIESIDSISPEPEKSVRSFVVNVITAFSRNAIERKPIGSGHPHEASRDGKLNDPCPTPCTPQPTLSSPGS